MLKSKIFFGEKFGHFCQDFFIYSVMRYIKTFEGLTNIYLNDNESEFMMKHAISEQDLELVKRLIKGGYDLISSNVDWLYIASSNRNKVKGNLPIIEELIKAGIDINSPEVHKNPLWCELLSSRSNIEYIRLLFDNGSDPNILLDRKNGLTPIIISSLDISTHFDTGSKTFPKLLEEFIKRGVDLKAKDEKNMDFYDHLLLIKSDFRDLVLEVLKKYDLLYKEYLRKLNVSKFNLK